MAKIKQKILAYKTAEKHYNKRKSALDREFTNEMHKALKAGNIEYYKDLKEDYQIYFKSEFKIVAIETLYKI